ncbi:uncharacterized protein METZ01_LOCUS1817 [marine metagenome]|uniref:Uncharacterized protein n=1 Tax=marine metagenome TaxID=408172 RepID=A0A381N5T3_9ZZZZ
MSNMSAADQAVELFQPFVRNWRKKLKV